MYYFLFINNYKPKITDIVILRRNYDLIRTKNLIIFLFNSSNFENLKSENEVTIVMSFVKLSNYREILENDIHITSFLKDKNSIHLLENSIFGAKYDEKAFAKNYDIFLKFLKYMEDKPDIIIVSSITYLLYGLRINRDIDIITRKKYKIKFPDKQVDDKYISSSHAYVRLFEDPTYTFYFKGFRITTIKTDILIKKNKRVTNKNFRYPKAVADLIMIKKLIDPSIKIPIDLNKLNKNKQERVLKKIKRFYRTDYNPFKKNNKSSI